MHSVQQTVFIQIQIHTTGLMNWSAWPCDIQCLSNGHGTSILGIITLWQKYALGSSPRIWSLFIIAGISLIGSLSSLNGFNLGNFINLLFLTIFIGIAEEFLCRGWLQNEFIERYGDTKRHIILSILFSSLIFGLIHLTNLMAGQDLLTTIIQVIQATSVGLLLGSI